MAMKLDQTAKRTQALTLSALLVLGVGTHADRSRADDGAPAAVSSNGATAGTNAAVEQRLREELRALMTEMVESGAFGDRSAKDIALVIDSPAQRVSNLGLLVDSARDSRDGLHVLGVTPGGGAERIGLRAADVVVALNGTRLAGVGSAATLLRHTVDGLPNGSSLSFEVKRDGHVQTLSGKLSSVELPAMRLTVGNGGGTAAAVDPPAPGSISGCGRISDFDVAPRQQQLHAAKIISVDDAMPGPTGSKSYQVPAGRHVLKIAEQIEPRYLAFNDRLRNSGPGSRYKTLEVEVEPNSTLFVAARLNEDKRNEWRDGAYWEPVVWRTSPESCN